MDATATPPPPPPGAVIAPPGTPPQPGPGSLQTRSHPNRQEHDARHARKREVIDMLPREMTDYSFRVWEAMAHAKTVKAGKDPIVVMPMSDFQEAGLQSADNLTTWLEHRHGPGYYVCQVYDNNGSPVKDAQPWPVTVGDPDAADNEEYDMEQRNRFPGLRRPRSLPMGEGYDDDDDEVGSTAKGRSAMADMLEAQAKVSESSINGSNNILLMLMMRSEQDKEARREEMREERRLEREREAREWESRQVEEQRRREEDERRRQERREEEQRRHEQHIQEMQRQQEVAARQQEAANKRMELLVGAIPAVLPVVQGVFKKDDTMNTMLIKSMLDRTDTKDTFGMLFQGMNQATKASTEMLMTSFKSIMETGSEAQKQLMGRFLDLAMANPNLPDEQKDTLGRIVDAISGASEIIKPFFGGGGAQQQVVQQQQAMAQQALAQQAMQQVPMLPAPQGSSVPQLPAPPPPPGYAYDESGQLVPLAANPGPGEQPVQKVGDPYEGMPHGVEGVLRAMKDLSAGQFEGEFERQHLVQYLTACCPHELRAAIQSGDEQTMMEQCQATVLQHQDLLEWLMADGVQDWIRRFLQELGPSLASAPPPTHVGPAPAPAPAEGPQEAPAPAEGPQEAPAPGPPAEAPMPFEDDGEP